MLRFWQVLLSSLVGTYYVLTKVITMISNNPDPKLNLNELTCIIHCFF